MNSKLVATSAGCFGLGALVSWAITADRLELKARRNRVAFRRVIENQAKLIEELTKTVGSEAAVDILDKGHTHLLEDIRPQFISLDIEPNAFGETVKVVNVDGQEPPLPEDDDEVDEVEYEAQRTNLQNLINQYTGSPEDLDDFVEKAVRTTKKSWDPPFVISKGKYSWDEDEGDEYEKITLTYYPRDRVLLDDADEVVEDVDGTVGWRNLTRFGDESEDPDVVFIRNRKLLTDFEVVQDDENDLPLHVKYGMPKVEFETHKAAGLIKFREEGR